MWSGELGELSRAYFEMPGVCVKSINGDFGVLEIDFERSLYRVLLRDGGKENPVYQSPDDMIKAGWAVD